MKVIEFNFMDEKTKCALIKDNYRNDGNLYIGLYDLDEDELFCDVTINLGKVNKGEGYLNTDMPKEAKQALIKAGIMKAVGKNKGTTYELFKFNI